VCFTFVIKSSGLVDCFFFTKVNLKECIKCVYSRLYLVVSVYEIRCRIAHIAERLFKLYLYSVRILSI